MSVITLPYSMEQDRISQIKANSTHVDANFDTLLQATNKKLENDGSILPVADLSMNNYKLTTVATPTASGDAATKGYVDQNACMLAGAQTITGNKDFTGTTTAVTQSDTDDSTKVATTGFVHNVLEAIYPVGAVYIGTQNTCPMEQFFGTWELVATGKALWGGNGLTSSGTTPTSDYANAPANTTIDAGLPDHNHTLSTAKIVSSWGEGGNNAPRVENRSVTTDNASSSNVIYGNSTTVQPPAYVVNVWRRTA